MDVALMVIRVRSEGSLVVAAAYPVKGLREGLRWVPFWDSQHHDVENCGLLVEFRVVGCRRGNRTIPRDKQLKTPGSPMSDAMNGDWSSSQRLRRACSFQE